MKISLRYRFVDEAKAVKAALLPVDIWFTSVTRRKNTVYVEGVDEAVLKMYSEIKDDDDVEARVL